MSLLLKTSLASVLLLSLTACGSSGSSSPSVLPNDQNNNAVKVDKNLQVTNLQNDFSEELSLELKKHGVDAPVTFNSYQVTIGDITSKNGTLDLSKLGNGLHRLPASEVATVTINGQSYTAKSNATTHLYQQPYSVVGGNQLHSVHVSGGNGVHAVNESTEINADLEINTVKGYATQTLPTAGTYKYEGVAFSQDERGKLAYSVNFDDRTGSGSITGITEAGNITLDKGSITARSFTNVDNTTITGSGIASTASSEKLGSGTYQLGFFGPNAEEIAGAVENNYGVVGFGGAKK